MKLTRRHWVAASVFLAAVRPRAASAIVIPVYDPGRFIEMVALLGQVAQLTETLRNGLTQLENSARALGRGNLLDAILIGHRDITSDLRSISYRMETVSSQFRRVFPNDQAVQNTPASDIAELRSGWNQEIHHSALAASRAQTALASIERNSTSANAILDETAPRFGA